MFSNHVVREFMGYEIVKISFYILMADMTILVWGFFTSATQGAYESAYKISQLLIPFMLEINNDYWFTVGSIIWLTQLFMCLQSMFNVRFMIYQSLMRYSIYKALLYATLFCFYLVLFPVHLYKKWPNILWVIVYYICVFIWIGFWVYMSFLLYSAAYKLKFRYRPVPQPLLPAQPQRREENEDVKNQENQDQQENGNPAQISFELTSMQQH